MKRSKRKRLVIVGLSAAIGLLVLVSMRGDRFRKHEKRLRTRFRVAVKERFPEEAVKVAASFGLHRFKKKASSPSATADRSVVLIHGLDDPGKVWMNLAPTLEKEGFDVWIMKYPNDQPIAESAFFFAEQLTALGVLGVKSIAIVSHSMGGLVSREMLTRPDIGYENRLRRKKAPKVSQLIMVGTPNHGSQLARFRVLTELRDQWVHLTSGKWHWLRWILDGAGEAEIDLIPGSEFLTQLNLRPLPEKTQFLIIAGVVGALKEEDIETFVDSIRERLPEKQQSAVDPLKDWLDFTANGLGDGLVTLDSTRLEGVAHVTVRGTHLSIIRNVSRESTRIPPAIPIIVDFLK